MPTPLPNPIDFVIVGGGPVGLLAANLIVEAGFTVRIFDIEYEPNHWGRGDWIHGRTLELLERAGMAEELLKTGVQVPKLSSYVNGQLRSSMDFVPDEVESKHQYLLCVGQHITEASLETRLAHHDIQVERPATVINIHQKEQGGTYPLQVTVMHLQDDAKTELVDCKYLLGCDGAHSDIRQQLGIAYEGETTETHAGVIDALVRTNFGGRNDVCMLQSDVAKTISLFPRENGLTRVFVHFEENENELRKEQHNRNKIQLEDIQREAKRALLPHRLEFLGILYWSVYVVGQRLAAKMDGLDRRVFLCGDAAHSQSPTLGQGINTGFGDVFNLIWKLCLVERGQLGRSLLATYETERQPIAQQVLAIDKTAAKAAAGHQSKDYCEIVEKNRAFTAGFGIQYTDKNALLVSSDAVEGCVLRPGMRAPNFKVVQYVTGQKRRLFDLEESSKADWLTFTMHILADDLAQSCDTVQQLLRWKKAEFANLPSLAVSVITTCSAERVAAYEDIIDKECILLDKLNRAQCHTSYRQTTSGDAYTPAIQVVLVRPDGYIGSILQGPDVVDGVQQYFQGLVASV